MRARWETHTQTDGLKLFVIETLKHSNFLLHSYTLKPTNLPNICLTKESPSSVSLWKVLLRARGPRFFYDFFLFLRQGAAFANSFVNMSISHTFTTLFSQPTSIQATYAQTVENWWM